MWACPHREGWSSASTRLCSDCYRWRRDRRIDGSRTEHPLICFTSIPPCFLQRPHVVHLAEWTRPREVTKSRAVLDFLPIAAWIQKPFHIKNRHYCATSPYSSQSFLSFTTKRPFQGFRKKPRENEHQLSEPKSLKPCPSASSVSTHRLQLQPLAIPNCSDHVVYRKWWYYNYICYYKCGCSYCCCIYYCNYSLFTCFILIFLMFSSCFYFNHRALLCNITFLMDIHREMLTFHKTWAS